MIAGLVIAALTATIIGVEATFPSPSDPALVLEVNEHLQLIAGIRVVRGLVLTGLGLALGIVRVHDWWDAGLRPARSRDEGPGWPLARLAGRRRPPPAAAPGCRCHRSVLRPRPRSAGQEPAGRVG